MAKHKKSVIWVIIATLGSAWLIYSGISSYVIYWMAYSFSQNFLDYLINPSVFELVKIVAGATYFTLMIRDMQSISKGFSIVGLCTSMVAAIFYVIGLSSSIKNVFFSETVESLLNRIFSMSLARYVAYSLLLLGMVIFFIAAIKRRALGKVGRVMIVTGAVIVYAVSLISGMIETSAISAQMIFSYTLADCAAYTAIALTV